MNLEFKFTFNDSGSERSGKKGNVIIYRLTIK